MLSTRSAKILLKETDCMNTGQAIGYLLALIPALVFSGYQAYLVWFRADKALEQMNTAYRAIGFPELNQTGKWLLRFIITPMFLVVFIVTAMLSIGLIRHLIAPL